MALFDSIQFVAWDGEGIDECECKTFCPCGGWVDKWTVRQRLALISVSDGTTPETLFKSEGLTLRERLNFVRFIGVRYPRATHVFYGGSYDFNKLLEGLPIEKVKELHESKQWTRWDDWIFRYRPRKELVIAHIKNGRHFQPFKPAKEQCDSYVRLWDVIGFFQSSFIATVKAWLTEDYPDYELIASGKIARLNFKESDRDFMIRYNVAECNALVAIMNMMHAQCKRLGLKLPRWDGAGAVAAEMFKHHQFTSAYFHSTNGKPEKIELDPRIEEATQYAYFGGRIESGFMGRHNGQIYNYDINSAYPHAASKLPNLNSGEWYHHQSRISPLRALEMSDYTLFRVQWYFHRQRLYYPFPFRTLGGAVIFPREGERWIYGPELKSAIHSLQDHDRLYIWEAWEFKPHNTYKDQHGRISILDSPFTVIETLYRERQKMVQEKDPAEKILKLGLNSLYGKMCQKLGWDEKTGKSPRFHFLMFGGWITSFTRARIYDAIQQHLDNVVSINTDGIITTCELPTIIPSDTKEFGRWSLELNDAIVQLQSGVYWLLKNGKWSEKARGLGRVVGEGITEKERLANRNQKIEERIATIESGWANGTQKAYFPVKLFVTSKKATIGPDWWPRWGHWFTMHDEKSQQIGRGLELNCSGWGKRRLNSRIRPNALTPTVAADNITWSGKMGTDDPKRRDLGERFDLPWINGHTEEDAEILDDGDIAEV